MYSKFILTGIFTSILSCNTVPDDAPQPFHDAEKAMERMDKAEVDETLPKTKERAEKKFDKALDMLDSAKEEDSTHTTREAALKAEMAEQTAEDAIHVHSRVKRWDRSSTAFGDALAALDKIDNPKPVVAYREKIITRPSPYERLKNSKVISTVAFFDTNKAESAEYHEKELDALVELLEKDKSFQVVLTGYADERGKEQYNKKLAKERAVTVAERLMKRGIHKSQIQIQSGGELKNQLSAKDVKKSQKYAQLQLDRKVRAELIIR